MTGGTICPIVPEGGGTPTSAIRPLGPDVTSSPIVTPAAVPAAAPADGSQTPGSPTVAAAEVEAITPTTTDRIVKLIFKFGRDRKGSSPKECPDDPEKEAEGEEETERVSLAAQPPTPVVIGDDVDVEGESGAVPPDGSDDDDGCAGRMTKKKKKVWCRTT